MKLPNNTDWRMAALAAAILIPGVHAKEPVFSSSDFGLKYGGAISNEAPTIFVEIPQLTKDLASSLEHDILDASNMDGNVVWNVEEFSRETLLRTYHRHGEAALNMQIFVDGEELLPFSPPTKISVPAYGNNGEAGALHFLAWPASAYRSFRLDSNQTMAVEYDHESQSILYGKESPVRLLEEVYGVHEANVTLLTGAPQHHTWAQWVADYGSQQLNLALSTYVYSDEMQLAFPQNDYPEEWSAVVDIEVVVL